MKENVKALKNKHTVFLLLSILFSVLAVLSIPGIIFGAIKSITILLVISIIFAVHGFYGLFFWWSYVVKLKEYLLDLRLINEQNYYSVSEIAMQTNKDEQIIVNNINWLIQKQYLTNYFFDGKNLTLNTRKKQENRATNTKCPCCGGNMSTSDNLIKCNYCGYEINKQ